jgi:protein-S-isoprenylcysteine O-methyltransferase Ste14
MEAGVSAAVSGTKMSALNWIERWLEWIGGLFALVTLSAIFLGLRGGLRRSTGRTAGRVPRVLRKPAFYLLAGIGYFGLCGLLWQPIPLRLSALARILALLVGSLLYFTGLALALWGRLTLGRQYFVSSSLGAQLFAGHRLITSGPYALVRHPMYLGIILTGIGGLLLYRTWTFALILLTGLGTILRARREEVVLAAEFGEEWREYCQKTPGWLPSLSRGSRE